MGAFISQLATSDIFWEGLGRGKGRRRRRKWTDREEERDGKVHRFMEGLPGLRK